MNMAKFMENRPSLGCIK